MKHNLLCLGQSLAMLSIYGLVGSGGFIFVMGFGGERMMPLVNLGIWVFCPSVILMVLTGWTLDQEGGLKEK